MRLSLRAAIICLALNLPGAVMPGADNPSGRPVPSVALAWLNWLAGSWRLEKAGRVYEEQWMAPGGGVMLGMARTVTKGRIIGHEFIQIRVGPGGNLFYIAQPSGQKEATFQLLTMTETEVTFENKEHDFPQTIRYALQSDGSMIATIEGVGSNGAFKRIDFAYKPVEK